MPVLPPGVGDGAIGTELLRRLASPGTGRPTAEQWPNVDTLTLDRPDLVMEVHHAYCEAGAQSISTNTFQATAVAQRRWSGRVDIVDLNHEAVRLAGQVRDHWLRAQPSHPRAVVGVVGPFPTAGVSPADVRETFAEQATGLLRGNVDVVRIETVRDIDDALAALEGIQIAMSRSPSRPKLELSLSIDGSGHLAKNRPLADFVRALPLGVLDRIGINCGDGLSAGLVALDQLAQLVDIPLSFRPSAGLPDAKGRYPLGPSAFARDMARHGGRVQTLGGCCGTTPSHIRSLVSVLDAGRHLGRVAPR